LDELLSDAPKSLGAILRKSIHLCIGTSIHSSVEEVVWNIEQLVLIVEYVTRGCAFGAMFGSFSHKKAIEEFSSHMILSVTKNYIVSKKGIIFIGTIFVFKDNAI
jgi:hypothetical protein